MDKEAQGAIAKRVEDETKGGYLQSWEEYNISLTQEQQRRYFLIMGELILEDLERLGYRKIKDKLCPTCRGKGEVPSGSSGFDGGYIHCINCKGSGRVEEEPPLLDCGDEPCQLYCHETQRQSDIKHYEVEK